MNHRTEALRKSAMLWQIRRSSKKKGFKLCTLIGHFGLKGHRYESRSIGLHAPIMGVHYVSSRSDSGQPIKKITCDGFDFLMYILYEPLQT